MVARHFIIGRKTIESTRALDNTQVHSHTTMKTISTIIGAGAAMVMAILLQDALIYRMLTVMMEIIILLMISITKMKYTVCTDKKI